MSAERVEAILAEHVIRRPQRPQSSEGGRLMSGSEAFTTHVDEWAIRCNLLDGGQYTGHPKTTRKEVEESGQRLAAINGADWWLVTRRRTVTVETTPWTLPADRTDHAAEGEA